MNNRLSILLNWLHERDPVRYDVYCTQVKVAGKAGLIDQINVSLDQVGEENLCFWFFLKFSYIQIKLYIAHIHKYPFIGLCGPGDWNPWILGYKFKVIKNNHGAPACKQGHSDKNLLLGLLPVFPLVTA